MFDVIVATTASNGIGRNNGIPWNLPEDRQHFKEITTGHENMNTVIMGRATWMSLPQKPLPNRLNIVVTSTPLTSLSPQSLLESKVVVANSLDNALAMANSVGRTFVIGGARLYDEALNHPECETVHVTRIKEDVPCDVHFGGIGDRPLVAAIDRPTHRFETYVTPKTITFDPKHPLCIIDASYMVFYRYNATLRWYTYKQPNIDYENITKDEEFVKGFIRHLEKDLKKLKTPNLVFCRDCPRSEIWRMKHWPTYESGRTHAASFNSDIFNVFYNYLKSKSCTIVKQATLEADDVAALVARQVGDDVNVVFITNDNDYLQLCGPRRTIRNLAGADVMKRSRGSAAKDLLMKILMGDKSDNIPAVYSMCGAKTAESYAAMSHDDMTDQLNKRSNAAANFERNRLLIDLSYIPTDQVELFNNTYSIAPVNANKC